MILCIDTETSHLWRDDLDPLDPGQPHLIQLGAQLYDGQWRKRGHLNLLIKPDGWETTPEAEAVHHIPTQACHRYGVTLAEALIPFRGLVMASMRIVGHHVEFDRKVIASAIHRAGGEGNWWARASRKFVCTMENSVNVLELPGKFGFKFPSLEEAYREIVDPAGMVQQHDADSDIAATVAVYRALMARNAIPEINAFSISKP